MRAKEFVSEDKKPLRKSVKAALPAGRVHPSLDNGNPYQSYRYGVALAGSPDSDMYTDGPIGSKLMTIGYTEAEQEIIKSADKAMGVKSQELTSKDSSEINTTNTTSVVANKKRNKYGV